MIHKMRKYFRTSLEGTHTKSQIERLIGHVSGEYLDGPYFRPPEADMVEAYRRAIPSLTVLEDTQSEEYQKKQLLTNASLFLSEEKLRAFKELLARSATLDDAVEEFKKLGQEPQRQNRSLIANSEEEMLRLIDQGWDIVKELNGGGIFIMKRRG